MFEKKSGVWFPLMILFAFSLLTIFVLQTGAKTNNVQTYTTAAQIYSDSVTIAPVAISDWTFIEKTKFTLDVMARECASKRVFDFVRYVCIDKHEKQRDFKIYYSTTCDYMEGNCFCHLDESMPVYLDENIMGADGALVMDFDSLYFIRKNILFSDWEGAADAQVVFPEFITFIYSEVQAGEHVGEVSYIYSEMKCVR